MRAWVGIATFTVATLGALCMAPAGAQDARDYGKRPIRMLVPVPPGGTRISLRASSPARWRR